MRLSAFNLYVDGYPEPGATVVYNAFTGGLAALDAATLAALVKLDQGEALSATERAAIDPELADDAVGILVADHATEEAAFHAWFERSRSATAELTCVVSTTFACNLRCTYCWESDLLSAKKMSDEVGAQTAAWLANRALEVGAAHIELQFLGGEPLLYPRRIEQIVDGVRARADGVDVSFGVITNGVLLTPELVAAWRERGLRSAQVTLDGDETTHSTTRPSRNGRDEFGRIFANAVAAAGQIDVTVRGNYQPNTAHGFLPLIDKLRAAGLSRATRLRFFPALASLGAPADAGCGAVTWSGSAPELMVLFADAVRRAGFNAGEPLDGGPCSFHKRHHYSVDLEGHIYKCPGFLGHAEWAVGHVATGLGPRYAELCDRHPERECGACTHRPSCAGGCVATAWMAAGRAEGVTCERDYFETQKAALVPRKYALAVADSPEAALAMFPPLLVPAPRAPEAKARHRG